MAGNGSTEATSNTNTQATTSTAPSTIVLIDGSGYIFRAYYAIRRLTTSSGASTNAVFGFTTMLMKILKDLEPTHIGIAFDLPTPTFRHKLYPEYKAHRAPMPEDLPAQIPLIHRVVDTFRIPKLIVPGFEADDVLGTLAERAKAAGHKVIIVTGDKDLMQLVDDNVTLLDELRMQRGQQDTNRVSYAEVLEKFGVAPHLVVDVLALAGDASDNVPGVDGIGEKTAIDLVKTYGDLEQILAHASEIKQQSRREKLIAQAENARLSKVLVTIDRNVPCDVTLDELAYRGPDVEVLRALFAELEFRRLLSDPILGASAVVVESAAPVAADAPKAKGKAKAKKGEDQADLFGAASSSSDSSATAAPALDLGSYRAVVDEAGLADVVTALGQVTRFAVRTEVDNPASTSAKLVGIAVAWGAGQAAWLPVDGLGVERIRAALSPLLSDAHKTIVAHDGKTDVNTLARAGFPTWTLGGDPMLASYLLDGDTEAHNLTNLARRYLEHAMIEPSDVVGTGKNAISFDRVPLEKVTPFACEAVDVALRTADILEPLVVTERMDPIYRNLELPLEGLLGKMERHGIRIDVERLRGMSGTFEGELKVLEEKAHKAAGRAFNLGSPQQIGELLFTELQLPVIKRTKTGPSTDSQVLDALADKHELPALILEHRTLLKLKNTYVDVLPNLVDDHMRVHTHFNQAVTATGRLSSTDPNLQNIPISTERGRSIRDAFIADDGNVLLSLDYSQIELRILAHVSEDPVLLDTFQKGEDVHRRTASEIFHVRPDDVTRDQRSAAKAINFGLLYGMGVVRLARELGIKRSEAKEYLDVYFERLGGIRTWHTGALERAHQELEVRTLFGRRRKLPGLESKNGGERARAERLAINTPIQGTAADIMKRAMIDADVALVREVPSARMLLQVHDELVIEVPQQHAQHALDVARGAMERAFALKVPLVVDGKQGLTWNAAH